MCEHFFSYLLDIRFHEISAFARYRGLKSFRTSPWDPKENLPMNYSRIFQFENFTRYRKHVLREELSDGIVVCELQMIVIVCDTYRRVTYDMALWHYCYLCSNNDNTVHTRLYVTSDIGKNTDTYSCILTVILAVVVT